MVVFWEYCFSQIHMARKSEQLNFAGSSGTSWEESRLPGPIRIWRSSNSWGSWQTWTVYKSRDCWRCCALQSNEFWPTIQKELVILEGKGTGYVFELCSETWMLEDAFNKAVVSTTLWTQITGFYKALRKIERTVKGE